MLCPVLTLEYYVLCPVVFIASPLASSSLCSLPFSIMPFLPNYLINTVNLSMVNCIWVLWVPFVTRRVAQVFESLFSLNVPFIKRYFLSQHAFLAPWETMPLKTTGYGVRYRVRLCGAAVAPVFVLSPLNFSACLSFWCMADGYLSFGMQFLYLRTWRDWSGGLN